MVTSCLQVLNVSAKCRRVITDCRDRQGKRAYQTKSVRFFVLIGTKIISHVNLNLNLNDILLRAQLALSLNLREVFWIRTHLKIYVYKMMLGCKTNYPVTESDIHTNF